MGVCLAFAMSAGGCGKARIEVMRYPVFYDPTIQTVAVLPMTNRTLHPMAGQFLAERVADQLRANGTYKIVGPLELANRLTEAKIELPANPAPQQIADALEKIGGIDAFLAGSVGRFGAGQGTYTEVYYDDPWTYGGYGYYGRGWGRHRYYYGGYYGGYYPVYRTYTYTQASVSATAALYRVPEAKVIYSAPAPAMSRQTASGGLAYSADEVLTDAAENVARDIVGVFAIVPRQIEVKVDDTIRPALREQGRPKYTTDFRPGDDGIYVEVSLPPEAALNEFRLAVAPKKRSPIAEQTFTWKRTDSTVELHFPLSELFAAGGGQGDYEIQLYRGDELQLERGIKIKD